MDTVEGYLKDMEKMVNTARAELEASGEPVNEHDHFKAKLAGWIDTATAEYQECQKMHTQFEELRLDVVAFFCEDKRAPPADFFGLFESFRCVVDGVF